MANEHAYEATAVGAIDVKELPERVAFRAHEAGGDPDVDRRALFQRNFRFLKQNHLKMTTPVERTMTDPPSMLFYVPRADEDKRLTPTPGVDVLQLPRRRVASIGMRGGYSERRFHEGEEKLHAWLAEHKEWRATGAAYGAYWNGPMMPAPLRHMEVHVPIEQATTGRADSPGDWPT